MSKASASFPILTCHSWVDSITVLPSLANPEELLSYRVKKVGELTDAVWSYVPTQENPSNFGTRGSTPSKFKVLRFRGPGWLSVETDGAKFEKGKKEAMLLAKDTTQDTVKSWAEELLRRSSHWKLLSLTVHLKRFINSCRKSR